MKKYIWTILAIIFFLSIIVPSFANADAVRVDFFYSKTCSHCAEEEKLLDEFQKDYPKLEIKRYEMSEKSTAGLMQDVYKKFNVPKEKQGFVPLTVVGEKYFVGYSSEKNKEEIKNAVKDLAGDLTNGGSDNDSATQEGTLGISASGESADLSRLKIPFLGEVDATKYSPLTLAVVLGILDGFNACAIVALGFLLAVLVGTGMRKKVILIGGTFILVSGAVYFGFMTAWLNLFMVVERMKMITYIVAGVVIVFAVLMLKDYFNDIICKVCETDPKKVSIFTKFQKKLFERMQKLTAAEVAIPVVLAGVAVVAAGINLVELVCSFGFPLAFTQILTNIGLPTPSYYLYILIYVIFYMIDDFLIFLIAVFTLRITGVSQKYLKAVKLISGIFLLILGFVMIFYPELLTLGR